MKHVLLMDDDISTRCGNEKCGRLLCVCQCLDCVYCVESWWSLLGTEYLLRLVQVSVLVEV